MAWALVLTVLVTRTVGKRIDYERPLGQVARLFRYELTGPRPRTGTVGGAVRSRHVRVAAASRRDSGTATAGRAARPAVARTARKGRSERRKGRVRAAA